MWAGQDSEEVSEENDKSYAEITITDSPNIQGTGIHRDRREEDRQGDEIVRSDAKGPGLGGDGQEVLDTAKPEIKEEKAQAE